jgi:hypothetical protein
MRIRITKKGLASYQGAIGSSQVGDPNDAWIRKILEYEAQKGSATGSGLSNFGYNNWQKLGHKNPPRSLDEAVEFYKQDFLPKVQQYPMGLRERMGDYIFNTGRNPNDLLLYNAGKITLDQLNSPSTFTNEWNQFGPEIEKQYSKPSFINSLDANKENVYKTTGTYDAPDPLDPTKNVKTRYSLDNPNPAFTATWQGRTNMWGNYLNPKATTLPTRKPVTNPTAPQSISSKTSSAVLPPTATAQTIAGGLNNDQLMYGANPFVVTQADTDMADLASNSAASPITPSPSLPAMNMTGMNYAWTNFGQAPTVPTPRVTTVSPSGAKTTTGNVGKPTVQYQTNNNGTPAAPFNVVRPGKKPSRSPFDLVDLALPVARYFNAEAQVKDARIKEMESRFNTLQGAPKFRGNFTINEGLFRPDDRGVNEGMFSNGFYAPTMQYGGDMIEDTTMNSMKIRITGAPQMAYGGQSNYGLDLGQRNVYENMQDSLSENSSESMSEQSEAYGPHVLEAEGGETILRPDGTHFNISGDRHHSGGVKLNQDQAPSGSFIFSDTNKMKIKDPAILAKFGVAYKKGGVTPAQIAKKFKLNDFKARLEDRTRQTDSIGMNSDTQMMKKNMRSLAELAMIQEAMKGEQAPMISQAILGSSEMAYGGHVMPKFQGAKGSSTVKGGLGEWSDDYETLKTLLQDPKNAGLRKSMFQNYLKDYSKSPLKNDPKGEDKFIQNLLEAQRQFMGIRASYADKPDQLTSEDWDRTGKNRRYQAEAKKLGYTPLAETDIKRFQGGYRALAKASRNPEFFENFSKYFKLSPIGVKDEEYLGQPISKDDSWVGNTTLGQLAQLRDVKPGEQPKPRYICDANGKIVTVATGGYATADEARKYCPEKKKPGSKYVCIDGQVITTESGVGYDTPEEAAQNCGSEQGKVPFEFLAPDKMNMAWKFNRAVPNIYLPEMYQLPRRQYPLALDDWFARVQNRQSTYNTAMDTAARTNQSQAVGSFLAGLVGAQDATDIAQVNSANLDRVDRRQLVDMETDFKNDVFNLGQRQEYSKGLAIAQQQFDNALNKGVGDAIQSFADAYENRGDLYDINMRDPYFYRHPANYKTIFKGSTGNIFNAGTIAGIGTNGAGGFSGVGASANAVYKDIYDGLTDVKDEKERSAFAKQLAANYMAGSRQTNTRSYDAFGFPRSSSRRSSSLNFFNQDDDQ